MALVRIIHDLARLEFEKTSRLIRESYWGATRTDAMHRLAFANSTCAIALADDRQVGFARAAGDGACFVRLMDVIVWPDQRGKGIGKALIRSLLDHPDLAAVPTWLLGTADAHALYEGFGFRLTAPGMEMRLERRSR